VLPSDPPDGGGGYAPHPDYAAQQKLAEDQFTYGKETDKWTQDFNTNKQNWQQAVDDRDQALAVGNQQLAAQKQADANYWEGKTLEVQQAMNNNDNATNLQREGIAASASMYGHQVDAAAQIQAAGIAADAARQASRDRLQADLAGAFNDQQRNEIVARFNQEQAAIAKMEDETKRQIEARNAQVAGYNAETNRADVMGNLALKNNQFIAEQAQNPRDLFSLYFTQRGLTPDWEALQAGNPQQGDALTVKNPMNAFTPGLALPSFSSAAGDAFGNVGSATGSVNVKNNPFVTMGMGTPPPASSSGGGFVAPPAPSLNTTYNPQSVDMGTGPAQLDAPKQYIDINPAGRQGGIPRSGLQPGLNLSTVGSDIKGSDIDMGQAYYDVGKTKPIGADDVITKGTQVYLDYPARAASGTGDGFSTARQFLTGDSMNKNPFAGGARPELIENPTRAPIRVQNTNQTRNTMANADYPGGNRASGVQFSPGRMATEPTPNSMTPEIASIPGTMSTEPTPTGTHPMNNQGEWNWRDRPAPAQRPHPFAALLQQYPQFAQFSGQQQTQPVQQQQQLPFDTSMLSQYLPMQYAGANLNQVMRGRNGWNPMTKTSSAEPDWMNMFQRFALGTDVSGDYANAGLGSLYQQSSGNSYMNGWGNVPDKLRMLADYGAPVPPGVGYASTGRVAPTLNLASAFAQRGGGSLPSMQALSRMTPGEMQNYRGYSEGVVGVPWADTLDFLGKPTQHLQSAQRSAGGI
jgi:hypothetical protein